MTIDEDTGQMNSIIGSTSSAGSLPALSSNWIIRSLRISASKRAQPLTSGVPYFRVWAMVPARRLRAGRPVRSARLVSAILRSGKMRISLHQQREFDADRPVRLFISSATRSTADSRPSPASAQTTIRSSASGIPRRRAAWIRPAEQRHHPVRAASSQPPATGQQKVPVCRWGSQGEPRRDTPERVCRTEQTILRAHEDRHRFRWLKAGRRQGFRQGLDITGGQQSVAHAHCTEMPHQRNQGGPDMRWPTSRCTSAPWRRPLIRRAISWSRLRVKSSRNAAATNARMPASKDEQNK